MSDPSDDEEEHLIYRAPGLPRDKPRKSDAPTSQRLMSDFLGSLPLSLIVGALIDRAFGTFPWGILGSLLFVVVIGLYSLHHAKQKQAAKDAQRNPPL